MNPFIEFQGFFFKGPIAFPWLAIASSCQGKAFPLAVLLCFQSGLSKKKTVVVQSKFLNAFGISRHSYYIALRSLEEVGLVKVNRRRGRRAKVTLLKTEIDRG